MQSAEIGPVKSALLTENISGGCRTPKLSEMKRASLLGALGLNGVDYRAEDIP